MAPYQSFPSQAGDSSSLDKLRALRLPPLAGKSFLDVGCEAGFFCGFAAFSGASRVVGIDRSEASISAARQRFPDCEFIARSWDEVPEGPFDVILAASVLHYADDQPEFVHRLLAQLAPGGTLVLELGVLGNDKKSDWTPVRRGIDVRRFPNWPGVSRMLQGWAWKHIGPSIDQSGDPVRRHVVHVTHRRPVAYLLMAPPAYGKSSLCRTLFNPAGVKVVSGDQIIAQIAPGALEAPASLARLIGEHFSPVRIDQVTEQIFAAGLGPELVKVWLGQSGGGDFALDAFIPHERQSFVQNELRGHGYMVVTLDWERVGAPAPSLALSSAQAAEYHAWLEAREPGAAEAARAVTPPRPHTIGHVDEITTTGVQLVARGWALSPSGELPARLSVRLGGAEHVVDDFERRHRPDVKKHLSLRHALVGFVVRVPLGSGVGSPPTLEIADAEPYDGRLHPFRCSAAALATLESLAGAPADGSTAPP